ncbi:hypothetical protein [Streptococcus equi]|uniref:hypothetical protein n=1 Tax=Streptococcus equi TaxID=1336 RepID=UPI001E2A67DE|nr:hypothetical protein [Streptococcus equi]
MAKKVESLKAEKELSRPCGHSGRRHPASQVYVRNKERAALAAGFKSETVACLIQSVRKS